MDSTTRTRGAGFGSIRCVLPTARTRIWFGPRRRLGCHDRYSSESRLLFLLMTLLLLPVVSSYSTLVPNAYVPVSRSAATRVTTELCASTQTTSIARSRNRPAPRPFMIERIGDCPYDDDIYRDIANMCIDVFFKEQLNARPEDRIP